MKYTQQEIFDKVWNHFVVEGNPRGYDKGTLRCVYLSPEGHRCAVGLFLGDVEELLTYTGNIEGLCREYPSEMRSLGLYGHKDLLYNLQIAHDFAEEGGSIDQRLRNVGMKYNLEIPSD